jgi:hypothetical protein
VHLTREQFRDLVEAGVLGDVEYLEGRLVMNGIPMTLSAEQRAVAAAAGIELPGSDLPGASVAEAALDALGEDEARRRAAGPVEGSAPHECDR